MRSRSIWVVGSLVTAVAIVGATACGDDDGAPPAGVTPGIDGSTSTNDDGSTATDGGGGTDSATNADTKPCTGLCLKQKACATGTTSLSGTVRDPAGKLPLPNAIVYVPNAPVPKMVTGVAQPQCDHCEGIAASDPLVSTITASDGRFKLENVPVGDVPLVIQIGKWRKQIPLKNVAECVDTPLDLETTRLPRTHDEGDIPQIALTTGGADVSECFLHKIGIADSEFTTDSGGGRVHLYVGAGLNASSKFAPTHQSGALFTNAPSLWGSAANLAKYDMVMLACEGDTSPATKPPVALDAMKAFTTAGGRLLATHFHRFWFSTAAGAGQPAGPNPSPFEPFATWNDRSNPADPALGTVITSTPKGQALKDWLAQPTVQALDDAGTLSINEARHNVDAVDATRGTAWITVPSTPLPAVVALTADTPIPSAQKCGRILYSDLHAGAGDAHAAFPTGCVTNDLTPQEKALAYLLFDLTSCIP